VKLLNTVKIVQKSGSKINTKNLMIDQSNDKEIYSTKETVNLTFLALALKCIPVE
jgi:hypothetical protein